MRLNGIFWFGFAAALGSGYLYLTTRVQGMDAELARIEKRVIAEREAIHVLKGEWSYLTRPARIAALARRHLNLTPITPRHIRTLADLPMGASGTRARRTAGRRPRR